MILKELEYPFDGSFIIGNKRKIKRRLIEDKKRKIPIRVAILGGSTTSDIKNCLELFLLNNEIEPVFYESDYNQFYEEAIFPSKELVAFKPDLIYIHTTYRNITRFPKLDDGENRIQELIDCEINKFRESWENLRLRFNCPIIQNNFEKPFYRLLGNMDKTDAHGKINFIDRLNNLFVNYAQTHDNFYICDIDYISSDYGLSAWHDLKCWYLYKYALNMEAIPYLAFNVANIIKSIYGRNKKGFVLDLDNTLWGGVIGDDGVENIEIGQELPTGQAYLEFQQYLKEHKQLGIILNIDSKNSMENAIAGLENTQSVLKPDDMIMIKANWEPKNKNYIEIAEALSLLPESLVFIDDNPVERHIVSEMIPGVSAPDIGEVQEYIKTIDHSGFFETTISTDDDKKRHQMYMENVKRAEIISNFKTYKDYLISLDMKASIKPFDSLHSARIAQLSNKSNQFNLTTKRYKQEEIEAIASDEHYISLYGILEDKFGNNGLISVVIGYIKGSTVEIELWIMSCRVLKRDMEFAMMDAFVSVCKAKGIERIIGHYYPTPKNAIVKDFFMLQGFDLVSQDEKGNTTWSILANNYEKKNETIKII